MGLPEAQAPAGGQTPPLLRQRGAQGDPVVVQRGRDWAFYAVVVAIAAGVVLRFVARGPLWQDEAQSVAIAGQPLHDLAAALRHDGSPPLWYALLHFWMLAFGHSTFAVRTLSAIPSLLAIPVVYALGRRLADKRVAVAAAVLLAVSPFAIRY